MLTLLKFEIKQTVGGGGLEYGRLSYAYMKLELLHECRKIYLYMGSMKRYKICEKSTDVCTYINGYIARKKSIYKMTKKKTRDTLFFHTRERTEFYAKMNPLILKKQAIGSITESDLLEQAMLGAMFEDEMNSLEIFIEKSHFI